MPAPKVAPGKKRVLLTISKEPYERLQQNIKLAGFPKNWFSKELDRIVIGLDRIIEQVIEMKKQRKTMTEEQAIEAILRASEFAQGMKIKKIEFEDENEES